MQYLILLFISMPLLAVDKTLVNELSHNAVDLYNLLLSLGKGMRWFFAILPVAAAFISISKDISDITKKEETMMQDTGLKGEDLFLILYHVVLVFISFFIIYGIFGMTYANASSMGDVWNVLVFDFWKNLI